MEEIGGACEIVKSAGESKEAGELSGAFWASGPSREATRR
jgi:hypothetical protein